MTHEDLPRSPSGRREAAGDSDHRQGLLTPSDGLWGRPERRLAKAFGRRRTLQAENLSKPSSWVIIIAPWYRSGSWHIS